MKATDLNIGTHIRRLRLQQRRTQQEIASVCGFTKSLLSKIESNTVTPPVATLVKIARSLGTSVSTGGDTVPRELDFGLENNPQLLLRNNNRGYCKCTLTEDTWTSEYRIVSTVLKPTATVSSLATFVVENGVPGATRVAPV